MGGNVAYDDKIAFLRDLRNSFSKNSSDYVILDLIIEDLYRIKDLDES